MRLNRQLTARFRRGKHVERGVRPTSGSRILRSDPTRVTIDENGILFLTKIGASPELVSSVRHHIATAQRSEASSGR